MENIGSIEVVRYHYDLINNKPKIVIEMVKLLDTNGKFIKFEKMINAVYLLAQYPVTFKPLPEE